ncbi:hypothetical protein [Streptomyces acidicola]|uniref:hypothetical protein n=1 Tax=Streptomyces acidicola TaxID=2596892 RepID=UPI00342ACA1D
MPKSTLKTWSARIAAPTMIALAAALAPAATAQAATPNTFTLCNYGSGYDAQASFPARGGFSTYVVPPGSCTSVTLSGNVNEAVNLKALNSGGSYTFGGFSYNDASGATVHTSGSYGAVGWRLV